MIDFDLNEEHRALVQTVREFAQGEVAPHIKEWDEKQSQNKDEKQLFHRDYTVAGVVIFQEKMPQEVRTNGDRRCPRDIAPPAILLNSNHQEARD